MPDPEPRQFGSQEQLRVSEARPLTDRPCNALQCRTRAKEPWLMTPGKKRAIKEQAADSSLCIFDQPAVVAELSYTGRVFF